MPSSLPLLPSPRTTLHDGALSSQRHWLPLAAGILSDDLSCSSVDEEQFEAATVAPKDLCATKSTPVRRSLTLRRTSETLHDGIVDMRETLRVQHSLLEEVLHAAEETIWTAAWGLAYKEEWKAEPLPATAH